MFTKEQKEEFAKRALEESCSIEHNTLQGGCGKPFWNVQAINFIYAPSFEFNGLPHMGKYIYEATDCNGVKHTFENPSCTANLSPIWASLPLGQVDLAVTAVDFKGNTMYQIGMRRFWKISPFKSDLPDAKRSYADAAKMAYDYAINQNFLRHWLEKGTPDPDYDLNVYPSKMIASIIRAMVYYSSLNPAAKEDAMKIAVNSADYLLSITYGDETPLKGLPPTYQIDFRDNGKERDQTCATARLKTVMMIYPATVACAYLLLEKETGDKKYYDGAVTIANYYLENICENGSWPLVLSVEDGKPTTFAYCNPLADIIPLMRELYERTGDDKWKSIADRALAYVEHEMLPRYHWEGQFEDSLISENYSNLTHEGAGYLAKYYARYYSDNPEKMKIAQQLAKFVEDQFVVWDKPSPVNHVAYDSSKFYTPCGLEQYVWYVPIDASTVCIADVFLEMYKGTKDELYLAKATALLDSVTRVQREDGMIPTHWMDKQYIDGENFWINCHFHSAAILSKFAKELPELIK